MNKEALTNYLINEANPPSLSLEQKGRLKIIDNWMDNISVALDETRDPNIGSLKAWWRFRDKELNKNQP
jgi:hypothetical protein